MRPHLFLDVHKGHAGAPHYCLILRVRPDCFSTSMESKRLERATALYLSSTPTSGWRQSSMLCAQGAQSSSARSTGRATWNFYGCWLVGPADINMHVYSASNRLFTCCMGKSVQRISLYGLQTKCGSLIPLLKCRSDIMQLRRPPNGTRGAQDNKGRDEQGYVMPTMYRRYLYI